MSAARSGPVGVGLIGTGMISNTYLENLTRFPDIDVVILGDLNTDLARSQAEKHGVRQSGNAADVLDHPGVELVVNLTIPAVHAQVSGQTIDAGKHVWSEKPISVDRDSGRELGCLSGSPRTRCWGRGCRRPAGRSLGATSGSRCRPRR